MGEKQLKGGITSDGRNKKWEKWQEIGATNSGKSDSRWENQMVGRRNEEGWE
jgi:hypothetical protein